MQHTRDSLNMARGMAVVGIPDQEALSKVLDRHEKELEQTSNTVTDLCTCVWRQWPLI